MRQVQKIMGMPISIDIPSAHNAAVFRHAFERLRLIDERFSTYKPDSEVSQFSQGKIEENQASPELEQAISACRQAEKLTDGYFSAWAGDRFDPSGYVKGWAVAEAGDIIEKQGHKTYCIGAGGDILASSGGEKTWNIGIQDPTDQTKILNMLSISNGAVATSGSYERGSHIFNPKTKQPADELLSVTVTGPDIIKADILATAVFAMGTAGIKFIESQTGYEALIIDKTGAETASGGFNRSLGSSP